MNRDVQNSWESFLNPEILRPNLIVASLYIAGFDLLQSTIVDRIRSFYITGFDKSGLIIDPKYQSDVLSKNRSPVYASLEWLKGSHAIDDADITAFERAKECRNEFAHAITKMLMKGLPCHSPKFRPSLESTACEISSGLHSGMNSIHVRPFVALVRRPPSPVPISPDCDD
jgi:hypothetical protein